MRNVEVYVNSEAIKSTESVFDGVFIDKTGTGSFDDFWFGNFSSDSNIGANDNFKVSFRVSKTDSSKIFEISLSNLNSIGLNLYTGSYWGSTSDSHYVSHTIVDEGDYFFFTGYYVVPNYTWWTGLRTWISLTSTGAYSFTLKDYSISYGSNYENESSQTNPSNWSKILYETNDSFTELFSLNQNTEDWTRLDLFDDETIQITDSIQDVKDIKKVFTAFSQTFKVPASDNNNKLFKHYYNADIDGYDGRFRKDALIKIDGVDYKFGKITLNSASLHNNLVTEYDLTFYGKTLELSDVLGDDTLRNLRGELIQRYNFSFNQDVIKDGFEDGYTHNGTSLVKSTDDNYDLCFPFISSSSYYYNDENDNDYVKSNVDSRNTRITQYTGNKAPYGVHYDDLKPALRIIRIIEAIEQEYPITFSDDFFSSSNNIRIRSFKYIFIKFFSKSFFTFIYLFVDFIFNFLNVIFN